MADRSKDFIDACYDDIMARVEDDIAMVDNLGGDPVVYIDRLIVRLHDLRQNERRSTLRHRKVTDR